jgi:hypothetical protein
VTPLTVSPALIGHCPMTEFKQGFPMKTVIAATLVLFSISTSAMAFEMPNIDGMDGIQQMIQGKGGKRGQQRAQQGQEGQGQQQQQSGQGNLQGTMKGLMNGDMSGLQGMMSSFGR